jgi:hypothetical protein
MRIIFLLTFLLVPPISLASDNVAEDLARMGFSSAGGVKAPVQSERTEPTAVNSATDTQPAEPRVSSVSQPVVRPSSTPAAQETASSHGLPKTPYRLGSSETDRTPAPANTNTTALSSPSPQSAPQPKGLEDELARMGFSKAH